MLEACSIHGRANDSARLLEDGLLVRQLAFLTTACVCLGFINDRSPQAETKSERVAVFLWTKIITSTICPGDSTGYSMLVASNTAVLRRATFMQCRSPRRNCLFTGFRFVNPLGCDEKNVNFRQCLLDYTAQICTIYFYCLFQVQAL